MADMRLMLDARPPTISSINCAEQPLAVTETASPGTERRVRNGRRCRGEQFQVAERIYQGNRSWRRNGQYTASHSD